MALPRSIVAGLIAGAAGIALTFIPVVQRWEEGLGLGLLFSLRGPREVPETAVIVSIDRETARHLGVSDKIDDWPRTLHARLLENLASLGAAVVVFDLVFSESRPGDEDRVFANAITRARRVVLCQSIRKDSVSLGEEGDQDPAFAHIETLHPLCEPLEEAALATAPFPLPKVPVRLNQFWKFKAGAGDAPTLPVVAFQVYALDAYGGFRRLLGSVSPSHAALLPPADRKLEDPGEVVKLIKRMRSVMRGNTALADSLRLKLEDSPVPEGKAEERGLLDSMISLYSGGDSGFLNFYGPAGTFATIPFEDLVRLEKGSAPEGSLSGLQGKAVFVGSADLMQAQQEDAFFTIYSREDGVDISGVEIAATAFSNLLDRSVVRQPSLPALLCLILLWGFAVGAASSLLSPLVGVAGALGLGGLYLSAAVFLFGSLALWVPLVVPLFFQLPSGFFGTLAYKFVITTRERNAIRKAFSRYLPDSEIDQLTANLGDLSSTRVVYSTLLTTDVVGYTSLSERIGSEELVDLMNRYYQTLFPEVKKQGGSVSDIVGDAMIAFWASAGPEENQRERACRAALGVARAVDVFNAAPEAVELPTKIALHSGYVSLGNIGAGDHFEFTPMGDIVNTAARLEGLNKKLGTRILVSEEVIDGLAGFWTRALGSFKVAGKTRETRVHELICLEEEGTEEVRLLNETFAAALEAYRRAAFGEASAGFLRCLELNPEDGPSRFFLRRIEEHRDSPPNEDWDGVVHITEK